MLEKSCHSDVREIKPWLMERPGEEGMELVVGPGPQAPATLPWPFQHEPRLLDAPRGPAQTLDKSETTQVTEAFSFLAQSMVSTV